MRLLKSILLICLFANTALSPGETDTYDKWKTKNPSLPANYWRDRLIDALDNQPRYNQDDKLMGILNFAAIGQVTIEYTEKDAYNLLNPKNPDVNNINGYECKNVLFFNSQFGLKLKIRDRVIDRISDLEIIDSKERSPNNPRFERKFEAPEKVPQGDWISQVKNIKESYLAFIVEDQKTYLTYKNGNTYFATTIKCEINALVAYQICCFFIRRKFIGEYERMKKVFDPRIDTFSIQGTDSDGKKYTVRLACSYGTSYGAEAVNTITTLYVYDAQAT